MIFLTKLNNETFVMNCNQIEIIELIPESKVVLMNREFYVVKETPEEIIRKVVEYNASIFKKSGIVIQKQNEDE